MANSTRGQHRHATAAWASAGRPMPAGDTTRRLPAIGWRARAQSQPAGFSRHAVWPAPRSSVSLIRDPLPDIRARFASPLRGVGRHALNRRAQGMRRSRHHDRARTEPWTDLPGARR
jgi:hypothetical protein